MSERATCSTCMAFNAQTNQCRRKSPVMLPIPATTLTGEQGFKAIGMYPGTTADGWCCEHLPGREGWEEPGKPPQSSTLAIAR